MRAAASVNFDVLDVATHSLCPHRPDGGVTGTHVQIATHKIQR